MNRELCLEMLERWHVETGKGKIELIRDWIRSDLRMIEMCTYKVEPFHPHDWPSTTEGYANRIVIKNQIYMELLHA